jgi:hypothetical protein
MTGRLTILPFHQLVVVQQVHFNVVSGSAAGSEGASTRTAVALSFERDPIYGHDNIEILL